MATLGRTVIEVPRLGTGAMTWGAPTGLARWHPAKTAYGGADSAAAEAEAFEASIAGGVTFFDTAAAYSGGAAEARLGELAAGRDVLIASKFPMSFASLKAEDFPAQLAGSRKRLGRQRIDLYQHHFPARILIILAGSPSMTVRPSQACAAAAFSLPPGSYTPALRANLIIRATGFS